MKSHTLPDAYGLSVEEAEQQILALTADCRGDPSHALNDRNHPQHGDFVTAMHGLYAAAHPEPEVPEPLDDDERADAEARLAVINGVPGFVTGEMRHLDRAAHDRLQAERTRLFEMLHPETPEVEPEGAEPLPPGQEALLTAAFTEAHRLRELGFSVADVLPGDIAAAEVAEMRAARIAAEAGDLPDDGDDALNDEGE